MAATEFEDSIPLDVAEFLFGYMGDDPIVYYSDIMDEFPPFQTPAGLSVKGSVLNSNVLRVALSTNLAQVEAMDSAVEAFTSNGWMSIPSTFSISSPGGFFTAYQEDSGLVQLCHDNWGRLSISYHQRNQGNVIVISTSHGIAIDFLSCADFIATQEEFFIYLSRAVGIHRHLPSLVMPGERVNGATPKWLRGERSGTPNRLETDATLEINWDVERVYTHFAEQMIEQVWNRDTESIGSANASGTWTQRPEENLNLVGTFNVVSLGENRFHLKLSVEAPGGNFGVGTFRSN